MLLLASFVTCHFGRWRESWHGNARIVKGGQPLLGAGSVYEGALALLDWDDTRSVLWSKRYDTPAGFCFKDDALYLCSMLGNRIYVLDKHLHITSTLSIPQMNDLHSVVPTTRGLLLTSSGLDGVLEISTQGEVLWHWLATEHGYTRTPSGVIRRVSLLQDLRRKDHGTDQQTTHCNSAVFRDPSSEAQVLVTLFHQGALIAIDRATSRVTTLVIGMTRPHSIRMAPGGLWTCCDSQNGSVVILNSDFTIRRLIEGEVDWSQDAFVASDGTLFVADANHNRVAAFSLDGDSLGELRVPPEWKFVQIEPVPPAWSDVLLHPVPSAAAAAMCES